MTILPWTPWRKAVQLRPDLLTGELTLSMFAADLHAVMTQRQDTVAAVYSCKLQLRNQHDSSVKISSQPQ